jgi:hypothetical protein
MSDITVTVTRTATTRQPIAQHDGVVSHYPMPPGDGWLLVGMSYDDVTAHYEWKRTANVPADLLTGVEAMKADLDGETSTLRADARYLRGLAGLGPAEWGADDVLVLQRIADRLDAVADLLLPEEA